MNNNRNDDEKSSSLSSLSFFCFLNVSKETPEYFPDFQFSFY